MKNPEEQLDAWVTHPPASGDIEIFRDERAIAQLLAHVGDVKVPADLVARLDERVQKQISAPASRPPSLPGVWRGPHPSLRRWIIGSGVAIILVVGCVGLLLAAGQSLPGDPLYGIKQWQQQIAYAASGNPHDASATALHQLQQALTDLQQTVAQGRSPANIRLALTTVATWTRTCQHVVATLPMGTDQRAEQQTLLRELGDERRLLLGFSPRFPWSLQVLATRQLGAIGVVIPQIAQVIITTQPDAVQITIIGQAFAAQPRLVVDGALIPATVLTAKATQFTALVSEEFWPDEVQKIGILNPDGTAAESTMSLGSHDAHPTGTPTPGEDEETPTPEATPDGNGGNQNLMFMHQQGADA